MRNGNSLYNMKEIKSVNFLKLLAIFMQSKVLYGNKSNMQYTNAGEIRILKARGCVLWVGPLVCMHKDEWVHAQLVMLTGRMSSKLASAIEK